MNAGVLYPSKVALTAQGYDATIGVNVVGHFLLHRLLYPLLSASGRESDTSRIIWLSSIASYKPHSLTYEAFREGPVRQRMNSLEMYSESKVAVVMLSTYLAKTCAEDSVSSIAVDPGNIKSEIYRSSPWYLKLWVSALVAAGTCLRRGTRCHDHICRIGSTGTPSSMALSAPCTRALHRKGLGVTER